MNGLPVLRKTADAMFYKMVGPFPEDPNIAVYVVVKFTSTTGAAFIFLRRYHPSSSPYNCWVIDCDTQPRIQTGVSSGSAQQLTQYTTDVVAPTIVGMERDTSQIVSVRDGAKTVVQSTPSAIPYGNYDSLYLFGTGGWLSGDLIRADFAAAIVCSDSLSDSDFASLMSYWSSRYSIG